jgi:hypothetical protein
MIGLFKQLTLPIGKPLLLVVLHPLITAMNAKISTDILLATTLVIMPIFVSPTLLISLTPKKLQLHTNGLVTIQHSPIVTEHVNISRLHPA